MLGFIFISSFLAIPVADFTHFNAPNSAVSSSNPGLQGMHQIVSKATGQGLMVNTQDFGSNVYAETTTNNEKFNWQLVFYGKSVNDYYLMNQYNMLVMGIQDASLVEGGNIVTDCFAKDTSGDWLVYNTLLFDVEQIGQYYAFKSLHSGLYLTLDGSGNAIQAAYTGSDNQLWALNPVDVTDHSFDQLIWAEEFDYTGLPDPTWWSYEQTYVNNELQAYMIEDPDNSYVENGYLRITAIKERWRAQEYTSARLITRDKFDFTYGMVEARIKVAAGIGTWNAFWMMPSTYDEKTNPWPDCGEIDIMEYLGYDTNRIHGTAHTYQYNGYWATNPSAAVEALNLDTDWHTYSVKWSADRIVWMVDGWEYFIWENTGVGLEQYPFLDPNYIILNLAIGGDWGGVMGVDDSIFPVSMYVDYVRVYQESSGIDNTPPAQVTGLSATAVSESQIDLVWDANSELDLDHYNIYRDGVKIAEISETSYSDTGLSPETSYTYEVSAVDTSSNEGLLSDQAIATTLSSEGDTTPPSAPTGLSTKKGAPGKLTISWDANSESDLAGYRLYRSTSSGGPYILVVDTTSTSYVDSGLVSGTTYYYVITAYDTSGNESTYSTEVSGIPR